MQEPPLVGAAVALIGESYPDFRKAAILVEAILAQLEKSRLPHGSNREKR